MLSHFLPKIPMTHPSKPIPVLFTTSVIDHLQEVLDSLNRDETSCPDPECRGTMVFRRFNEPQCRLVGEYSVCDYCGRIDA